MIGRASVLTTHRRSERLARKTPHVAAIFGTFSVIGMPIPKSTKRRKLTEPQLPNIDVDALEKRITSSPAHANGIIDLLPLLDMASDAELRLKAIGGQYLPCSRCHWTARGCDIAI